MKGRPQYLMFIYGSTILLSAFLLFQVQPLIGKFILPWFGGSSAVWNTCLLFFQAALLAGYAYAHLITRYCSRRLQVAVHLGLLLASVACLPIMPGPVVKPSTLAAPTWQILRLLALSVGLPYFVLSATGPLLQAWLSRSRHHGLPYRLYALSNGGSLLALVSYPFVVEPALPRHAQAEAWGWGMIVFALLCAICAVTFWRSRAEPTAEVPPSHTDAAQAIEPGLGTRALWFALAACGSILLLSVTNKLCQDVAVIPLLWVLPLVIYLLTFILCFDSPKWYWRPLYHGALWFALGGLCLTLFDALTMPLVVQVGVYCAGLFACCMVCHGELYRLKPSAPHLTAYYLTLAAGGAMGALVVVALAPLLFSTYLELHVGMVLCVLLMTLVVARESKVVWLMAIRVPAWRANLVGAGLLTLVLGAEAWQSSRGVVSRVRNFYGVLSICLENPDDAVEQAKVLRVGEIIHGMQLLNSARLAWPTSYFSEQSGVGLAWRHLPNRGGRRIGVVGLGAGTLAVYGREADTIRFYELNPAVRAVAETEFTFLRDCLARVEVIMGDARLSLEGEPSQQFDLLVLDAFSSDSVPVHLLTEEAFAVYLRHLQHTGVLAINVSNKHLDLLPVARNLAARYQLKLAYIASNPQALGWWKYPSQWVLLTSDPAFLEQDPIRRARALVPEEAPGIRLWTDDYASLSPLLR